SALLSFCLSLPALPRGSLLGARNEIPLADLCQNRQQASSRSLILTKPGGQWRHDIFLAWWSIRPCWQAYRGDGFAFPVYCEREKGLAPGLGATPLPFRTRMVG